MKRKEDICTYKYFLTNFMLCAEDVRENLKTRLYAQPRPDKLCGKDVPTSLNAISYGMLDDIRRALGADDVIAEVCKILLDVEPQQLYEEDVNDVFGFLSFVSKELDRINKIFSSIKTSFTKEEEAAGVRELDFGSFGILDWYARRMRITNQNEVRDVAWVRIYQCMKNDNAQSEYERRLQQQYLKKHKK